MTADPQSLAAPASDGDHAYFQAVEEIFVGLRGAPLLLSPADWQVARRWHSQGVPLDLVRRALEEVFARRRERGVQGRISSLRYCAHSVEAAWASWSEMMAPGMRAEAPGLDAASRLAALASALATALGRLAATFGPLLPEPASSPSAVRSEADAGEAPAAAPLDPATWRERVAALAALGRDAQRIEERLAELDRELLEATFAALPGAWRADLDAAVDKTLAGLASRIPAAGVETSRGRLRRQILRQRLRLPLLSLFSPEAAAEPTTGSASPDLEPPPATEPAAGAEGARRKGRQRPKRSDGESR